MLRRLVLLVLRRLLLLLLRRLLLLLLRRLLASAAPAPSTPRAARRATCVRLLGGGLSGGLKSPSEGRMSKQLRLPFDNLPSTSARTSRIANMVRLTPLALVAHNRDAGACPRPTLLRLPCA